MSFRFHWPQFSEEFQSMAREQLEVALNKGAAQRPAHICDDILVKELQMGTLPPDLEVMEIGELSTEKFRGMFRLTYNGDAYLVLQTKVQATSGLLTSPYHHGMLSAHKPLVVPMLLKISQLRLRGIMTLVVDQWRGVTLSFKNDPLESVQVNSTFDDLTSVKKTLQNEIEKHLRELFVEELPSLIHTLSLKHMGLREQSVEEVLRKSSHHNLSGDSVDDRKHPAAAADSMDSGLGQSMDDGMMYGGGGGGGGIIGGSSSSDLVRDSLDTLAALSLSQERADGFRLANIEDDPLDRWMATPPPPPPPSAPHLPTQTISLLSPRNSPEKSLAGFGASLRSLSPNPRSMLFASLPSLRPTANVATTAATTTSAPGSPLRRSAETLAGHGSPRSATANSSPKQKQQHQQQRGIRRSVPFPNISSSSSNIRRSNSSAGCSSSDGSASSSASRSIAAVAAPPVHYLMKPALPEKETHASPPPRRAMSTYSHGHSVASAPAATTANTTTMTTANAGTTTTTTAPQAQGFSSLLRNNVHHRRSSRATLFSPTKSIRSRYNDSQFVDTEDAASLPNFPTTTTTTHTAGATTSTHHQYQHDQHPHHHYPHHQSPPTIRRTSSHTADTLYSRELLEQELRVEGQQRRILGPKRRQWVFVVGGEGGTQPPSQP